MAMLDDIKAAEIKAAKQKEKAAEEAKEYAAKVSAKAAADADAAICDAKNQAARMIEKAEEQSRDNASAIIDAGKSADKEMTGAAGKNVDAAVAAVFAKLK